MEFLLAIVYQRYAVVIEIGSYTIFKNLLRCILIYFHVVSLYFNIRSASVQLLGDSYLIRGRV